MSSSSPTETVLPEKKWYALSVTSRRETNARDSLRAAALEEGCSDRVGQVLIPEETSVVTETTRAKTVRRTLYPGYMFVEMDVNEEVWAAVRKARHVKGFVQCVNEMPVALTSDEAYRLRTDGDGISDVKEARAPFIPGQLVSVRDGAFKGFEGRVTEVRLDKARVVVEVSVFGRVTPVEMEIGSVKELN